MYLNNSRADEFINCNRRSFWNQEFRGTGLTTQWVDENLAIGTIVHAGLAELYVPPDGGSIEAASRAMDAEFAKIFPNFEELAFDTKNDWLDNMDFVRRLVRTYEEEAKPSDDFVVLQVETPFCVVLGEMCYKCGEPYPTDPDRTVFRNECVKCEATIHHWIGRIDMAINRGGGLKIVDHKTAKSVSDNYLASWHHSMQLAGYSYGYGKALGTPVTGYGVNILRKLKTVGTPRQHFKQCPTCRNGKNKRLTCDPCNATGKVAKENDSSESPFQREWCSIEPEGIERFKLNRLRTIEDIETERERFKCEPEAAFPMNPKACYNMGKCPFIALCHRGDPVTWYEPPEHLLQNFDPRPDDYVRDIEKMQTEEMR